MQLTLLFAFIFLVFLDEHAANEDQQYVRTWQTNLNYNNSHNWDIGRVPCEADRVVLPRSEGLVLELPAGRTTLRGLVMPEYSEIVLPSDGLVQFSGSMDSPTCQGKDAVFNHTKALHWIDALNWNGWNKATPDLERVPCTKEEVRFLPGASYNILVPEHLQLGVLELHGHVFDAMDWVTLSYQYEGLLELHQKDGSPLFFSVSGDKCPASRMCDCGNSYLQNEICTNPCPLPLCKQPVQPHGFCCPICGVYLHLGPKEVEPFIKSQLSELLNSKLKDKGVVWHASYVRTLSKVQLVLMEQEEYREELSGVAQELRESLINSGMFTDAEVYASGRVWYPTTFGQVAGHFFVLLVFAALTIATLVVFTSQNWYWTKWLPTSALEGRPFVFARFENQTGELMVSSEQRPDASVLPQAFDNPMYGATKQEQRNVTVENPMYTELEETARSNFIEDSEVAIDSTDFT